MTNDPDTLPESLLKPEYDALSEDLQIISRLKGIPVYADEFARLWAGKVIKVRQLDSITADFGTIMAGTISKEMANRLREQKNGRT